MSCGCGVRAKGVAEGVAEVAKLEDFPKRFIDFDIQMKQLNILKLDLSYYSQLFKHLISSLPPWTRHQPQHIKPHVLHSFGARPDQPFSLLSTSRF